MRPIENTFLIKADTDSETSLPVVGLDGENLFINKRFNPLNHTIQYGEVVQTPLTFSDKNSDAVNLKVGDKVFFHYLVCQQENLVNVDGQDLYLCYYNLIWAKMDNDKLIPLDKVLFAEYIVDDKLESDSGLIIKQYESNVAFKLKVFSVSDFISSKGINSGDTIIVIKGAGIPIKDTNLVWLKLSNIVGVEANGRVEPLDGINLILEDEVPDIAMWKGLMVGDMHRPKFCTGIFIKGDESIKAGSKVTYIHSMYSRFELDGIKYAIIEKKDLISISG